MTKKEAERMQGLRERAAALNAKLDRFRRPLPELEQARLRPHLRDRQHR